MYFLAESEVRLKYGSIFLEIIYHGGILREDGQNRNMNSNFRNNKNILPGNETATEVVHFINSPSCLNLKRT